jgi:methionine biosynthesis protein MetW
MPFVKTLMKVRSAGRRIFAAPSPAIPRLDYDDYWENRAVDEIHPRFRLIARMVSPGSRVLDVGCGDGSLLIHLESARHTKGLGLDISEVAVAHARGRGVRCEVADVTSQSFVLPQGFDVVIISEVLEHIPDPESLLSKVRDAGVARLIVTVPNTGYLEHRLRLLFGRFPIQWLVHPGEHLRFWTIADFTGTAESTGFRVARVVPVLGWFPFARFRPSLFSSQVIYDMRPNSHST